MIGYNRYIISKINEIYTLFTLLISKNKTI